MQESLYAVLKNKKSFKHCSLCKKYVLNMHKALIIIRQMCSTYADLQWQMTCVLVCCGQCIIYTALVT